MRSRDIQNYPCLGARQGHEIEQRQRDELEPCSLTVPSLHKIPQPSPWWNWFPGVEVETYWWVTLYLHKVNTRQQCHLFHSSEPRKGVFSLIQHTWPALHLSSSSGIFQEGLKASISPLYSPIFTLFFFANAHHSSEPCSRSCWYCHLYCWMATLASCSAPLAWSSKHPLHCPKVVLLQTRATSWWTSDDADTTCSHTHLRQGPICDLDKGTYIIVNTCRIIKQMCLQKTLNVEFSKWRTIRASSTSNLHI